MDGVTQQLADYSAGLQLDRVPSEVIARARLLILDLAGNMIRARHDADSTTALLAGARALGLTAGTATVFGDAAGYTPGGAALVNGALGHSLDFDDTHAAGSLHPGCPVIPAAIAAGEMVGASGADVLAGVIAGYEVVCRLALALPAGDHYQRGYHPTATCGAFGAAAAASRVFGLDSARIEHAFGIALSTSAGSLQFLANGAWTKRFQVGWASMAGLTAATLAREGFTGAARAFEGKHGFLNAYAPNPVHARAVQGLGTVFELMATAVKPYPSCRYGHAGIDAALALRTDVSLQPDEIEAVTLGLPESGMLLIGTPALQKANPRSIVDCQFSGPFVIASAFATGGMGWDSYNLIDDPAIRGLLPRISCAFDLEAQAEVPANMSAKLTVHARGRVFERFVAVPKGEPGNFLTDADLKTKFMRLSSPVLGEAASNDLADEILVMERAPTIATVLRLVTPGMIRSPAAA